jgi:hypothetical protein
MAGEKSKPAAFKPKAAARGVKYRKYKSCSGMKMSVHEFHRGRWTPTPPPPLHA